MWEHAAHNAGGWLLFAVGLGAAVAGLWLERDPVAIVGLFVCVVGALLSRLEGPFELGAQGVKGTLTPAALARAVREAGVRRGASPEEIDAVAQKAASLPRPSDEPQDGDPSSGVVSDPLSAAVILSLAAEGFWGTYHPEMYNPDTGEVFDPREERRREAEERHRDAEARRRERWESDGA